MRSLKQKKKMYKIKPKTYTDEAGITRTLIGIHTWILGISHIYLDSPFSKTFYIAFEQEGSSNRIGERNVTTGEFVIKMVLSGMPEEQANQMVKTLCSALEYGTREQRYQAAVQLAASYGHELLPIEQQ